MSGDFGGISEAAFLSHIRKRSESSAQSIDEPDSSLLDTPSEVIEEDRLTIREKGDLFARAWEAVGGRVKRASTLKELYAILNGICIADGVKKIVYSQFGDEEVVQALAKSNIEVDVWSDVQFERGGAHRQLSYVNTWDAGVVWVDYAVAETGSVVVVSREEQSRVVSLLPPRFYAIISPETLVYSRKTVFQRLSEASLKGEYHSSVTFITGPSRSADIEMDLSIGVHGPGEVTAILLEV